MSIFEYDKEEEERKLRKAEFEAGEQSGIQKGIQKGIQEGIQEGKENKRNCQFTTSGWNGH